jgi:glutamyl/glutaminyl-tRNA synthetase
VAYYQGPEQYHASYAIRVKSKDISKLKNELDLNTEFEDEQEETEELTQFAALLRLNETASKVNEFLSYVLSFY